MVPQEPQAIEDGDPEREGSATANALVGEPVATARKQRLARTILELAELNLSESLDVA